MENEIIEVGGVRWKIRTAKTLSDAMEAITMARVSGSIGSINIADNTATGGSVEVLADVVQVTDDGTERVAYSPPSFAEQKNNG